jgi:hypothetical protein
MNTVIFDTEKAAFKFDLQDVSASLQDDSSFGPHKEAVEMAMFLELSPEPIIDIPKDKQFFKFIALDLLGKGKGSALCYRCKESYTAMDLRSYIIGSGESSVRVKIKRKGGPFKKLFSRRIKKPERMGGKGYQCLALRPHLPEVTLLGTGGTIASRLDYRTGAVIPAFTPGELYGAVPELADICNLTTRKLFGVFSENMAKEQYLALARSIGEEIEAGADGIVIGHGTDTMGYTAAAMSFALQELPVPVVIVGAQRSADRPSSDAATNLTGAVVAAAKAPFAEVALAMHATSSDNAILLHRGTKVRKCHTSRRDAFKSINADPLAKLKTSRLSC